jgi:hypothetical protein
MRNEFKFFQRFGDWDRREFKTFFSGNIRWDNHRCLSQHIKKIGKRNEKKMKTIILGLELKDICQSCLERLDASSGPLFVWVFLHQRQHQRNESSHALSG